MENYEEFNNLKSKNKPKRISKIPILENMKKALKIQSNYSNGI
jgi:hypothetical protein